MARPPCHGRSPCDRPQMGSLNCANGADSPKRKRKKKETNTPGPMLMTQTMRCSEMSCKGSVSLGRTKRSAMLEIVKIADDLGIPGARFA